MPRLLPLIILLGLILAGEPGRAGAASLDAALRHALAAATAEEIAVIVTLHDQVAPARFSQVPAGRQRRTALVRALREQTELSQRDLRLFLKANGILKSKPLWTINGLAFQASPALIGALAGRPEVDEIRLDGVVNLPTPVPNAVAGTEWNIGAVGAPLLWGMGLTGNGVVVASLDSGVDPLHSDLAARYRGGVGAWFDPNDEHATPYDKAGHGTAVMGLVLGGEATGSAIGVAPEASWIAAKIFNDAGSASYSAIHQAFAWVLDPDGDGDSSDAPQVVNNSWGLDAVNLCLPEFQPDIKLLKDNGIAVVFSGGNSGPNPTSSTSPANYPESLAVGAVDQTAAIASFSGRGPGSCPGSDQLFPQLAAPGVNIKSADLTLLGIFPNAYGYYSGTSFSAPHVSGLMALLLGQNGFPATLPAALETALENGADDLGALGPDNTFGHGLANGLAAYRRLRGQPHLAVHDPRPPEHDRQLDFGSLPVGAALLRTLTLRNSGGGLLVFANHDWAGLSPALAVTEDLCSAQTLAANETCRLTVSFAPPASLTYTATLSLSSNDPDYNPLAVSLSGSGNTNPTPPTLRIEPAGLTLEFGAVPPGATSQRELIVGNAGQELLTVEPLDFSGLAAPFALVADGCGGTSLANNETCSVLFSFSPVTLQDYQAQVTVSANDPENSPATVILHGNGNHPPLPATLISPPDGATGQPTTLILRWRPGTDPDSDTLSEQVVLTPAAPAGLNALFSGPGPLGGGCAAALLLLGVTLLYRRTRAPVPAPLLLTLAATLALLAACGGSGGEATPASVTYSTYTATNLSPNTTYNWKVVTTDSRGASTASPVWHFTTR